MKTRTDGGKPASIAKTRWASYAAAGAATALTGSHSAEAAIHYSGILNVPFPPHKDHAKKFPLDQAGEFIDRPLRFLVVVDCDNVGNLPRIGRGRDNPVLFSRPMNRRTTRQTAKKGRTGALWATWRFYLPSRQAFFKRRAAPNV
jgi:hypothetical protein